MNTATFFRTFLIFFFAVPNSFAQTVPSWHITPAPILDNRYDDIMFINEDVGWAVNFSGVLIKTSDRGNTWQTLNGPVGFFYRSVRFVDSIHGFIGKLAPSNTTAADTNFFYKTDDGGNNWTAVENFPGPGAAGICGMCSVNDSFLYAVGRYDGPAGMYKSADKGITWEYHDMSAYASGLVDCYFWSADSGIVIGDRGTAAQAWDSGGVILSTFDGGDTWQVRYENPERIGVCWKISFPSRNIGYVSLQEFNFNGNCIFLKTTDGGLNWEEKVYSPDYYNAEGIGFINDTVGWIGGDFTHSYMTIDGGDTWIKDTIGITPEPYPFEGALNRFRFISDTLGYGSGMAIYRYSKEEIFTGISTAAANLSLQFEIYPNPSNTNITVLFDLLKSASVKNFTPNISW
jgi:photosystem II stability/assembly factor-like uncharacterized protein